VLLHQQTHRHLHHARGTGAANLDAAGRPVGQGLTGVKGWRVQGALHAERVRVDWLERWGKRRLVRLYQAMPESSFSCDAVIIQSGQACDLQMPYVARR